MSDTEFHKMLQFFFNSAEICKLHDSAKLPQKAVVSTNSLTIANLMQLNKVKLTFNYYLLQQKLMSLK